MHNNENVVYFSWYNNFMKYKVNKKGFTLIELLVVIFIIGLLASIATYALGSARAKARDTRRVQDIRQLNTALLMYYTANGSFPQTNGSGNSWPETTNIPPLVPTYIGELPKPPSSPGNGCSDEQNKYYYRSLYGNAYSLTFCIGSQVGSLSPGYYAITASGMRGRYDMDGNGVFNNADVSYMAPSLGHCWTGYVLELCDITKDGTMSGNDQQCLLEILNQIQSTGSDYPLPAVCT